MSGTAASGAPLANGTVTILCGLGEIKTGTTGTDGSYSVDVTGCKAPYVVTVTATIGETQDTLVSVQPTDPATGSDLVVNVTPITHAIAALVSSTGNPLDLANNFSSEKSGVTAAAVSDVKQSVVNALADVLTAAGESASFDPINGKFTADGTKFDRVLDNVKVETQLGGMTLTNNSASKVDDMAEGSASSALPANSQLSFTKSSFKTALATKLPANADDNSFVNAVRDTFHTCFAAAAAQRGTVASLGSACASLPITGDYKNDGKTAAQELNGWLGNSNMDGAKFGPPEVIRFFSSERALVKLSAVRADGIQISFRTVLEKSANTGNAWKLRGNQRPYFMFVNGVAERRIQFARPGSTAPASYYASGLALYFDYSIGSASATVSYVKVTGPGLPAGGQILRRGPAGCDEYFVVTNTTPPAALPNGQPCTGYLRLTSKALDGSATDPNAASFGTLPQFAAAKVSDADIVSTIKPLSAYTFEVHEVGGAVRTFVERLRGRPAMLSEIDNVRWNVLADSIQAAMQPSATPFMGGNVTIGWVPQANTPPVQHVQVQIRTTNSSTLAQDMQSVPIAATSKVLTNANGTPPGFPAIATSPTSGFNFVQLISRNRNDMQIFSNSRY